MSGWIVIIVLIQASASNAPAAVGPPKGPATPGNYVARLPNGAILCEFPEEPNAAYYVVELSGGNKAYGIIEDPNKNPFTLQKEMMETSDGSLHLDQSRSSFGWDEYKDRVRGELKAERKERRDNFLRQQGFEKLTADGGHPRTDGDTWVAKDQLEFARRARNLARAVEQSEGESPAAALFAPDGDEPPPPDDAAAAEQAGPGFLALWGRHVLILGAGVTLIGLVAYATLIRE